MLLTAGMSHAAKPARATFSIDWGISPNCAELYRYSYVTEIGYRIADKGVDDTFLLLAYMSASAGVTLFDHLTVAAYAGYDGFDHDGVHVTPLGGKILWTIRPTGTDGPMVFLQAAMGLKDLKWEDRTSMARIGAGYRHCLSSRVSVDLTAAFKAATDQPLLVDPYEGVVPAERTSFSRRAYLGFTFGLSLNF